MPAPGLHAGDVDGEALAEAYQRARAAEGGASPFVEIATLAEAAGLDGWPMSRVLDVYRKEHPDKLKFTGQDTASAGAKARAAAVEVGGEKLLMVKVEL